jgi:hypothetical protein
MVVAMVCAGCANEAQDRSDAPVEVAPLLNSGTRIFGGSADKTSSVVALKIDAADGPQLCSGALIAPNVVLTARHCVAKSITSTVSCDQYGNSTNGPHVKGNYDAADIGIYVGASPRFTAAPDAVGAHVVSPDSDTLCDQDIAIVVLDRNLADIAPLAVRVGSDIAVAEGESVKSIGYGQNDAKMPLGTRLKKEEGQRRDSRDGQRRFGQQDRAWHQRIRGRRVDLRRRLGRPGDLGAERRGHRRRFPRWRLR